MEEGFQDGGMPAYGNAGTSGQQDSAGPPPQHGNLFVKGLPPGDSTPFKVRHGGCGPS